MKLASSSRRRFSDFRIQLREKRAAKKQKKAEAAKDKTESHRWQYLRQYAAWLRPHAASLTGLFLLAMVGIGFELVKPLLSASIIDNAINVDHLPYEQRIRLLAWLGLGLIGIAIANSVVDVIRSLWMATTNAKVIFRLRRRLHDHLLRLSLTDLAEMKSGGIISRLSGDVDSAMGLVQSALISPAVALTQAVVAVAILLVWNWRLALATMAIVPPFVVIHLLWLRKVRPLYRAVRDDRAAVDGRVAETFGGIRVVRAFRREPRERHDYAVGHHTAIRKGLFATYLQTFVGSGWSLLMPGISAVILWYGGYLVITTEQMEDKVTVGQLFAFQWYVFLLLGPVMRIVHAMTETQRALAAMERIFDLLEKPLDKPDPPDAVGAPAVVHEMRFDGVGFHYREETPVLENLNLVVPGGSVVALVGPSGAGKTTLTDLIARFHDPQHGRILINGVDLRQIRLGSYRRLLGIVQQDVFLFDGTVRENIAYGRRNAGDAAIITAAQRANAHEFILQMPDGYDTLIGERGVKLSGGQRQRLSIARAILADPQILILDEATSNLDTESEQLIQAALADLYAGRTTFVIAHRLSTVTHADMIVVLDQGRVVETGTHEQLVARGGSYARMVERQRQSFDVGELSI